METPLYAPAVSPSLSSSSSSSSAEANREPELPPFALTKGSSAALIVLGVVLFILLSALEHALHGNMRRLVMIPKLAVVVGTFLLVQKIRKPKYLVCSSRGIQFLDGKKALLAASSWEQLDVKRGHRKVYYSDRGYNKFPAIKITMQGKTITVQISQLLKHTGDYSWSGNDFSRVDFILPMEEFQRFAHTLAAFKNGKQAAMHKHEYYAEGS